MLAIFESVKCDHVRIIKNEHKTTGQIALIIKLTQGLKEAFKLHCKSFKIFVRMLLYLQTLILISLYILIKYPSGLCSQHLIVSLLHLHVCVITSGAVRHLSGGHMASSTRHCDSSTRGGTTLSYRPV